MVLPVAEDLALLFLYHKNFLGVVLSTEKINKFRNILVFMAFFILSVRGRNDFQFIGFGII